MAFKRVLIPALLEQEGLFARKSSSNILSDPRILEHLRHVAEEAQLEDENEDNESDDSELEHQKQELKERITAYNNRNQGGAFRVTQNVSYFMLLAISRCYCNFHVKAISRAFP